MFFSLRFLLCLFLFKCHTHAFEAPPRVKMAHDYLQSQEQQKAFEAFLQALDGTAATPFATADAADSSNYDVVLSLYLSGDYAAVEDKLDAFVNRTDPQPLCGFLLAAAYANRGDFSAFFDLFYPCYCKLPDHYLAKKTRAVLHIKLFERANNPSEKNQQKKMICSLLHEARRRYALDPSLYKMLIAYAPEERRPQVIEEAVTALLKSDARPLRTDIPFYVQHAAEAGLIPLAQRFLDQAKEWYPISKVIAGCQATLDQFKRKELTNGPSGTR